MKPDLQQKQKFYKHLKIFLIVMGLMIFFSFRNGTYFTLRPWMVIWGIGLMAHYLGVFGGGCQGNRPEPLEDPRSRDQWKDSDLV
jgi:hypothetical protein